jgi:hypothetical protein
MGTSLLSALISKGETHRVFDRGELQEGVDFYPWCEAADSSKRHGGKLPSQY